MPAGRPDSFAASKQISAGPAYVYSIGVEAGADTATVALANKASSGGTRVQGARAQTNAENYRDFGTAPIYFGTAIYATVTGTTPVCEVVWAPA